MPVYMMMYRAETSRNLFLLGQFKPVSIAVYTDVGRNLSTLTG